MKEPEECQGTRMADGELQEIDEGGAAFPTLHIENERDGTVICQWVEPGMTMRQYYAAKAMQAFIKLTGFADGTKNSLKCAVLSARSLEMADAMIAAEKVRPGDVEVEEIVPPPDPPESPEGPPVEFIKESDMRRKENKDD